MKHIEFPMFDPCFLWGSWIMDFGWTSIFYLNCYVQYFCPKLQVKFLHKNHAFNALHNCSIGIFHDAILLWWIWITCLLLDSTFIQFFDLHARFVFHQHIIYFEYFKNLSFGFQRIKNVYFLWMWQNIIFHHGLFKTYLPRPKPTFLPTYLIN
jgi:hypothetical protein